jgi:pimeloyl-ACP methyl ester carboxylesterase
VSHGIFQGCDGALLSVQGLRHGRRVIAPSRFGYLGSVLPPAATPADQADAFVAVLDHLEVERTDVVGISAGATAALQFALRNPDRIAHLVIISGNLPGSSTAVAQPQWARLFNRDLPMWTLKVLNRRLLARLAGVPEDFQPSAEDDRFLSEFIDSFFPIYAKARGIDFDTFISNPDVNGYPLEQLTVPTLLVHARDDPLVRYQAAAEAAQRIPGSTLVTLESGGHLGLGQEERIRREVDSFVGLRRQEVRPRPLGAGEAQTGRAREGVMQ